MLSVRSKPSSLFTFCVQKASRVTWHTLFTNSADFSSAFWARFTSFTKQAWICRESIRAQCCYSRSQVQPPVSLWFRNHKSLHIATITRWSSSIPGFSLSCRLKLDSSNPSNSSNANMCSDWSLNPRIAFEMSDHTAGKPALSGLWFSISIPRFGSDMIISYFPSESNVTIAYINFTQSGRCAFPETVQTRLSVLSWEKHLLSACPLLHPSIRGYPLSLAILHLRPL